MSTPAVLVLPMTVEELRALVREELAAVCAPAGNPWVRASETGLETGARKRLTRQGKLPTYKRGRVLWVKRADLDACLEAGRVQPKEPGDEFTRALAMKNTSKGAR